MRLKALIVLIVLGSLGYSGLWYYMGQMIKRMITQEMVSLQREGAHVAYGQPVITGYPYRMEISFPDITVAAQKSAWALEASSITAIGHVWSPGHWFIKTSQLNASILGNIFTLSGPESLASLKWNDKNDLQISFDLTNLTAGGTLVSEQEITAQKAEFHLLVPHNKTQNDQSGLMAPLIFKGNLRLASARGKGSQTRPLDRAEIIFSLHGKGLSNWSREALSNWRDEGGTIEVNAFSASWGISNLQGNASISLDESFKPLGSAVINAQKADFILEQLKKADALPFWPQETSGTLTLMAQGGTLSTNGIQLLKLEPIIP